MSALLGLLNISEAAADRTYVQTIGQRVVYDAMDAVVKRYNQDLTAAQAIFVERETSDHKFRYKLPGNGKMQRRGGQAQSGAVKAYGQWDVALPLEDFGAQYGGDDIALAYMSAAEAARHLETVMNQNTNTVRFEMLKAIFNSGQRVFEDDIKGSLTVEPLANNDAVLYPPVLGSESEATENHYLRSGYVSADISNTNNPYKIILNELEEHYGAAQGGGNVAAFIHPDETAKTEALDDFVEVTDRFTKPGDQTATLQGLPANIPGRVIGRVKGVWIVEWRFIPSGYIFGEHLDAPKPLLRRVDPADTGLKTGLHLVAEDMEYPLKASHYRNRYGFGAGNRLNGVVIQLATAGTYTVPAIYQ